MENSCCSSSSTFLRDPSFSTKKSSVLLDRNVGFYQFIFLSKSTKDIIIGIKNDPELDKPVIEAGEALDDKEKVHELVDSAEVEPEVKRDSKMAAKSSQGTLKTFKNLKHSSPARKFNIFGKNVVKIIVF